MKIIQGSDVIYGFPRVSDGVLPNGIASIMDDVMSHVHSVQNILCVRGNQVRLLVDVTDEHTGCKTFGHITINYNVCGVSNTLDEIQHLDSIHGVYTGKIIVAHDESDTKEIRVAVPTDSQIPQLHDMHITLSCGIHTPVMMSSVATAYKSKQDFVLQTKERKHIKYHITETRACTLTIIGVFVIVN